MEEKIALYMKNLGISREEAIALIADDANDVSVELSKEQAEVVKEMTRTTGDKTQRKARQRKPDADKRFLIEIITDAILCDSGEDDIVIDSDLEREINFIFHGVHYRLTLSKPRVKK